MEDSWVFFPQLLLWALTISLIVWRNWQARHEGVGLVLAYCFQLWLLFWLGAVAMRRIGLI